MNLLHSTMKQGLGNGQPRREDLILLHHKEHFFEKGVGGGE